MLTVFIIILPCSILNAISWTDRVCHMTSWRIIKIGSNKMLSDPRLARQEERLTEAEFGESYLNYAVKTPAFFPRLGLFSVR